LYPDSDKLLNQEPAINLEILFIQSFEEAAMLQLKLLFA